MANESYEDIINMEHHRSKFRVHMKLSDRAAQFSAFAALSGYDDVIKASQLIKVEKTELDDDQKALIDQRLQLIKGKDNPFVTVTYFCPENENNLETYITVNGNVRRVDSFEKLLIMTDGTEIHAEDISDIEITQTPPFAD